MRQILSTIRLRVLPLLLGVGCLLAASLIYSPQSSAAPNSELNFQGRLQNADGSLVDDGNYHVQFNLYSADTGGASLWNEAYTGGTRLRVANGYFTANLGSQTAFPSTIDWGEELWLTINIGGNTGTASYDGEMTPRTKVTATPFAFRAGQLQGIAGGYTADELVQLAPTSIQGLNDALAAIRLDQTGAGGLLQLQGDGTDSFVVAKDGTTSIGGATAVEALNVNGAINFGNASSADAGTIRWTGTDFEGFDGTIWNSLTSGGGGSSGIAMQVYSSSTANVNTAGYTAVAMDNETFKDAGFTHDNATNSSRVILDDAGRYFISYSVAFDTANNNRRSLECAIRLNGSTILLPSQGYDYARNNTDDNGSISATTAYESSAPNEYYEVVCRQAGSGGTVALLANQSWTLVTTTVGGGGGGGLAIDAFENNGNAFGAVAILGTTDAEDLQFVTSNTVRMTIDSAGNITAIGDIDLQGAITFSGDVQGQNAIVFQGATDNAFTTTFEITDPTANNIISFPDTSGTVILDSTVAAVLGTTVFTQDGNSFGVPAVLGTNDGQDLLFETNDIVRATLDTNGDLGIAGTNLNVDSRFYAEDNITVAGAPTGTTLGPYTFDTNDDADEAAWTFISDNGANGLNISNTARAWSHDTNDTTSGGVGPTFGQGGDPLADGYVYTETSTSAVFGDTFHMTLNTPIDANADSWIVDFYWNQRGDQNLATVDLQTNEAGAGWVTRGTYGTGGPDVVSNAAQQWNFESVDLTGIISNASTEVRFLVTAPAAGTIWHNDFALDTITVRTTSFGYAYSDNVIEGYNANAVSDVDLLALRSDVGTVGDIKFRVDSDGDVFSDGTNNISGGADIAELYKNYDGAQPGDVVYFVDNRTVARTNSEHQVALAGVVSADAAVVLDAGVVGGIPIGLKGRVPTNVSMANGPIKIGDYLTSSATGKAVRAIYSGSVIGIAMEDATLDGQIDVFVNTTYYNAPLIISLEGVVDPLTNEVVLAFTKDDPAIIDSPEDGTEQEVGAELLQNLVSSNVSESTAQVITDGFSSLQLQINSVEATIGQLDFGATSSHTLDLANLVTQWQNGELEGALKFTGQVTFLEKAIFKSGAIFDSNTAGVVVVEKGVKTYTHTFDPELGQSPYVQLTPSSFVTGQWRLTDVTQLGFTIDLEQEQPEDVLFNWHATETVHSDPGLEAPTDYDYGAIPIVDDAQVIDEIELIIKKNEQSVYLQ